MLILSHRGDRSAGAPENSLEAFDRALQSGADGVETDVRIDRDGLLLLHHDRVSPHGDLVGALSQRQLESQLGRPVGTVIEALGAWPGAFWNLEIKAPAALPVLLALLDRLAPSPERLLLTSFRHDLVAVAAAESRWRWGIIQAHRPRSAAAWVEEWRRLAAVAMVWDFDTHDPALLAAAAGGGFRNFCYGVQTPAEHAACQRLPLVGVITDHLPMATEHWVARRRAAAGV
jgi:glycerophosphoryl diester phosphodiesterase